MASLERSAKVEAVKELKEKVRVLCLQQEPSNSLILLTLEELAKTAWRVDHDETDVFEELARQASRHQDKLNISSLCLSVLGGKAADAITKAIAKCIKEKQSEEKPDCKPKPGPNQSGPKSEDSPLYNLYPPYQVPFMYGMQSAPFFQPPYSASNYRGRPRQFGFRPRGACLFCESTSHQVKDCEKMKAAKGK